MMSRAERGVGRSPPYLRRGTPVSPVPPSLRSDLASALAELALRELAQAGFGASDLTGRSEAAILADALDASVAVLALAEGDSEDGPARLCVAATARWDGLPDTLPAVGPLADALARAESVALRPVPDALAEAGISSGITVRIGSCHRPFALVVAVSPDDRAFDADEQAFLRSAASALHARFALDDTRRARGRAEASLGESEARARTVLDTTIDGVITIDEYGVIEGFNPAAERIFGYAAHDVIGRNLSVLMPEPYRSEHDGYLEAYRASGVPKIIGAGREVVGRCKDGSTFPMDLAVSEVRLPEGRRVFTGFVRDISARRELEREVLRATEDERRRIGQDLHDGLGQELSTLGLFLTSLAHTLDVEGSAGAPLAHRVVALAEGADARARQLARSFFPIELAEAGLSVALRRMAERTGALHGVGVAVDVVGDGSARADALTPEAATHVYWIAQEALSNAVRHGRAHRVRVILAQGPDHLRLRVENDGVPFAPPARSPHARPDRGMGLRIMGHRARLVGGTLDVRPGAEGGAVVTCAVPLHGPGFQPSPPFPPES